MGNKEHIYISDNLLKGMKTELRECTSCGEPISDRYFLEVGGCSWHGSCLRCCVCLSPLDRQPSCFLRERQVYCKADYAKNFGAKCSKCCRSIAASDWVRRARELVFHLACFACDQCGRQLSTGEQFALFDDRVLCKAHYLETVDGGTTSSDDGCDADGYHKSKAKRVRTTFTEEQLQVLQANFQIDSNPDGQDLERIASVTGLSKRVTQVWFQNSRARQKKHIHHGVSKPISRDPDPNAYARHINLQLTYSLQNPHSVLQHLNNNHHHSNNNNNNNHNTTNAMLNGGGCGGSTTTTTSTNGGNPTTTNTNSSSGNGRGNFAGIGLAPLSPKFMLANSTLNYESSLDDLSQDASMHCMHNEV